jgi:hypothetical protein
MINMGNDGEIPDVIHWRLLKGIYKTPCRNATH